MLIEHMSKGLSFQSFAGVIGVHKDTIYHWLKIHDDFSDAKGIGFAKSLLLWEQMGIDGLYAQTHRDEDGSVSTVKINANLYAFNMKNRFGWTDKQEHSINQEKSTINLAYNVNDE